METNQRLYPEQACTSTAQHAGFMEWVQKQRMYYGELFSEAAASRLDRVFTSSHAQQQAMLLAALRMIYAASQPDKFVATLSCVVACHS
jgi:DNA-binding SARP family transcriptional activator